MPPKQAPPTPNTQPKHPDKFSVGYSDQAGIQTHPRFSTTTATLFEYVIPDPRIMGTGSDMVIYGLSVASTFKLIIRIWLIVEGNLQITRWFDLKWICFRAYNIFSTACLWELNCSAINGRTTPKWLNRYGRNSNSSEIAKCNFHEDLPFRQIRIRPIGVRASFCAAKLSS